MDLKAFRVQMYRSITESEWVNVDRLTVFVGRNESGKTALFRALHKLNPDTAEAYDIKAEWPRGRWSEQDQDLPVATARFALSAEEMEALKALSADSTSPTHVEISRTYSGELQSNLPDASFPNTPMVTDIEELANHHFPTPSDLSEPVKEALTKARDSLAAHYREASTEPDTSMVNKIAEEVNSAPRSTPKDNDSIKDLRARIASFAKAVGELATPHDSAMAYLEEQLPTFIYLSDYRTFSGTALLDQVKERRDSKKLQDADETFLIILELAGLSLDDEVKLGSSAGREYRGHGHKAASKRLTTLLASRIEWRKYEFEIDADGMEFFTFVKDDAMPERIKLEERSRGMQWLFSFDLLFHHGSRGSFANCVILLDEPGLHLHPRAQESLLERLAEYAKGNTILYTTHLPFMIDLRHPERIRVISDKGGSTVVTEDLTKAEPDAKLVLESALGMSGSQSYLVAKRNLVVEGVDDYWIITALSNLFARAGQPSLPDDVLVTPAGGASEAVYIGTFMVGQELNVVVLFDSDEAGRAARDNLVTKWLTKYGAGRAEAVALADVMGKPEREFSIEDIFPEQFYIDRVMAIYGKQLDAAGAKEISLPPGPTQVVKKVQRFFNEKKVKFNKGSVAKVIRSEMTRMKSIDELPDETRVMAAKLIEAIRTALKEP
ncbi:MAG: AAA family ATPase [Nitrososphaerota archaeon]|nr:AAA family ATPase [Nitrososphaerota archaeon]